MKNKILPEEGGSLPLNLTVNRIVLLDPSGGRNMDSGRCWNEYGSCGNPVHFKYNSFSSFTLLTLPTHISAATPKNGSVNTTDILSGKVFE